MLELKIMKKNFFQLIIMFNEDDTSDNIDLNSYGAIKTLII